MAPRQDASANEVLEDIELSDRERQLLQRAIGGADTTGFGRRLEKLGRIALKEWVEWIVGKRRFSSLAECDSARVLELFLNVREEPPSVEQLVEDLAIPEARASSMLARMRYGSGRELRKLAFGATDREVKERLAKRPTDPDGRKTLVLGKEAFECVHETAWEIMKTPDSQGKGQKYAGAELPSYTSSGRLGGMVTASPVMWNHIGSVLAERAKS